ncbi:hypothetical protein U9M48_044245 [Paspalum notatum var. saurae]|uniref:IQ-domain 3 n=1 Tax=Paspalum notatum var. saurae TaxID=547442 RepID=A0AAQ3UYW1_PASNO
MGRKVKWFDTVQKILSTSEPADHAETEAKAAKLRDKPSFKKIWQFGKSSSSGASTSTSAAPAPGLDAEAPQHQQPPSPWPAKQHAEEKIIGEESMETTRCEEGERVCRPAAEAAAPVPKAGAGAAPMAAAAAAIAGAAVTSPTAWIARSKEDIAATRIQAACRGYLARRPPQERAIGRLMSLVEGFTVKRQTEEALYCMQTMTRIQTQIYSRRLKTEEDKKALKSQVKVNKQSLDKIKIGEGWDHSLQSKEQMEAVLTMKQEAASRRQRALSYAFSHQWRNRNPSSARGAAPAPTFMDPGNPNWGWGWTERWMAAARPWENQTAAAPDDGRAAARSAGRQHRVAVSILIPTSTTTTTTPRGGSKPFRPPSWPSLPSPSTPPPRSPSLSGRTTGVPASPRSGPLHHAASGLQRTKSLQPDRRPRSSQERSASSQELSVSSPRRAVPASPRRSGSGSPLHPSSGLARAPSQQTERRPRSSQERAVSSPRSAGKDAAPTLRRTTSLRAELPRRLSLGSAAAATPAGDDDGAPVTPSYMQPTKSVRAKIGCQSPSALAVADVFDAPESGPAPLQLPSPSSAKKRMSLAFADNKPSASSPSKVAAERVRRHSQPPSPRMSSLT